MRRTLVILLATIVGAACSQDSTPTAPAVQAPEAPLFSQSGGVQLQEYIVVFNSNTPDPRGLAQGLVNGHGGTLGYVYETALRGFSARLPEAAVNALLNNPNVAYIEPNGIVTAAADQSPATWGLDRIDQRDLPLNSVYSYATSGGAGVTAYVLDTGIRADHIEFTGRVLPGHDVIDGDNDPDDCHGHGTHVAGTVAGTTWGVAKSANLVGVRVLGCSGSGSTAGVIAGIDWITLVASGPSVANMSLSGGASTSLDEAVRNSIAAGVVFAVAASNEDADACLRSPAREALALTVGSTTSSDNRSSFSNYGTCVDLFAPGSGITSASYSSQTAATTMSGTSMASPHVAGAAALYLGENPNASTSAVFDAIIGAATPGKVGSPGAGSPNLLLYNQFGDSPPPVSPKDVSVSEFTVSTAGKKRVKGVATLRIVSGGDGVAGATVTGVWSGSTSGADSGVTDSNGHVTIQSPNVRNGTNFTFCVSDVTGPGLDYAPAAPDCATNGGGGGGGGEAGPLSDLTVRYKTKGKTRTTLSWSGGPAQVDISNNEGFSADGVTNTGQWQGNGAPEGATWSVCPAGSTEGCLTVS